MSEKKSLKRAVKAVWDQVKSVRAERAKLYSAADVTESADQLAHQVEELRALATQLSALNPMPPGEPSRPKRKRKAAAEK
jgi:hypothetical protein